MRTEEEFTKYQKCQTWIITILLCVVVFLSTTVAYEYSLSAESEKTDVLAKTLSQVNEMLNPGNSIVPQINEILIKTGYSGLQRTVKIPRVIEEEEIDE